MDLDVCERTIRYGVKDGSGKVHPRGEVQPLRSGSLVFVFSATEASIP